MKNIYYPIPGHAGVSFGFYGTRGKWFKNAYETFYEGLSNRNIVASITAALSGSGLIRESETSCIFDVPVKSKVTYFKRLTKFLEKGGNRPVILACHTNAAGNGRENHPANGLVVWCDKSEESRQLAEIMSKNLYATGLWRTQRGVKVSGWWKGKFLRKLGMVLGTPCPSVIIEFGFHTNKRDRKTIQDSRCLAIISETVKDSLVEWERGQ